MSQQIRAIGEAMKQVRAARALGRDTPEYAAAIRELALMLTPCCRELQVNQTGVERWIYTPEIRMHAGDRIEIVRR